MKNPFNQRIAIRNNELWLFYTLNGNIIENGVYNLNNESDYRVVKLIQAAWYTEAIEVFFESDYKIHEMEVCINKKNDIAGESIFKMRNGELFVDVLGYRYNLDKSEEKQKLKNTLMLFEKQQKYRGYIFPFSKEFILEN